MFIFKQSSSAPVRLGTLEYLKMIFKILTILTKHAVTGVLPNMQQLQIKSAVKDAAISLFSCDYACLRSSLAMSVK